ncbi:FMN-dependent NADH-azoreductase [Parapusillimonas granuli]|uniref:FMN dependent NADH:quinone oxidoreductase n=1 Tax=Parapusillimonas granuli TaxID=380911 RepID=A0A853FVW3_9BURK|nr:NAD(P)H-dependent oxidoreductase [Parapusillimonas granuli]MBB5217132.1 FMN-dependent NADH-azoreductase [Parapusillimonas granuli]NYT50105.1 NAD(P)H-dependent oxidoreductase [Parapusillimonas granuli]
MKLLHVDSSINGANSVSRKLTKDIVTQWLRENPDTQVDYLDLANEAPGHFSSDAMGFRLPPSDALPTEAQQRENALSEALVSQFLASDVIVIGAPLYNFAVPSQLKAWIDRLAQAGRTFKYTEKGPVGLAGGKTIIAALSRGGIYSTSEAGQAMEHQESYLKTVFGFFGITDIRIVRAEGTDLGAENRSKAFEVAEHCIKAVATRSFEAETQAA